MFHLLEIDHNIPPSATLGSLWSDSRGEGDCESDREVDSQPGRPLADLDQSTDQMSGDGACTAKQFTLSTGTPENQIRKAGRKLETRVHLAET